MAETEYIFVTGRKESWHRKVLMTTIYFVHNVLEHSFPASS